MSESDINNEYCVLNSNLMPPVCYEAPIDINLVEIVALLVVASFFFLVISNLQKEE